MKKYIAIIVLTLICSCTNKDSKNPFLPPESHIYKIAYKKCSGEKDTVTVQSFSTPCIANYNVAVPYIYINLKGHNNILNVCEMEILEIY